MHCYVDKIENNDLPKGVYLLRSAQQGQTAKGDTYWSIKLADSTGQVDCKIWSPLASMFSADELKAGAFVSIEAKAQTFKDNVQLVITNIRVLNEEERANLDLSIYIASSPYPVDAMREELDCLIDEHITYPAWKKFVKLMFEDPRIKPFFFSAPAAKSMHHAYLHGLLEHTLGVCRNCVAFSKLYPALDKQTLLVGALFHDIGKIEELSGALATEYTHEGNLIGHTIICIGMMEAHLQKAKVDPRLAMHLKHLILSHHGLPEYGAVKVPTTAEAWLLHYADNIDAKVNQCLSIKIPEGEEVAWQSVAFNQKYCNILGTPSDTKKASTKAQAKEVEQVSLLDVLSNEPKQEILSSQEIPNEQEPPVADFPPFYTNESDDDELPF